MWNIFGDEHRIYINFMDGTNATCYNGDGLVAEFRKRKVIYNMESITSQK